MVIGLCQPVKLQGPPLCFLAVQPSLQTQSWFKEGAHFFIKCNKNQVTADDSSPPGSLLTFRKSSPGSICMSSLTWGSNFDFWLRHIASLPHLTCLSKPSQRETKPPSNSSLLSLDLSLATRLPLLSCWRCLTRHDVQLERMFASTLLLRAARCVSLSQPRELCVVQFRSVLSLC